MALQEQNHPRLLRHHQVGDRGDGGREASEAISRAFHVAARAARPARVAVVLPEDLLVEETTAPLIQPRIAVRWPGPRRVTWARPIQRMGRACPSGVAARPDGGQPRSGRPRAPLPRPGRRRFARPTSAPHLFDPGAPATMRPMSGIAHRRACSNQLKHHRPLDRAGRAPHRHAVAVPHLFPSTRPADAAGARLACAPEIGCTAPGACPAIRREVVRSLPCRPRQAHRRAARVDSPTQCRRARSGPTGVGPVDDGAVRRAVVAAINKHARGCRGDHRRRQLDPSTAISGSAAARRC